VRTLYRVIYSPTEFMYAVVEEGQEVRWYGTMKRVVLAHGLMPCTVIGADDFRVQVEQCVIV
jgi:hypothetical protein